MDKDFLFGILYGTVPTRDALVYLGYGELPTNMYSGHTAVFSAYIKLVNAGHLDGTRIYNLASKSFDGDPNHGDIGLNSTGVYRYHNGWEFFSTLNT